MKQVKFTQMKDGDAGDYALLDSMELEYANQTGQRVFDMLQLLAESFSGYKVTRLTHSIQSATRAWRDGADIDWVVCALLHDIGDSCAPYNHDAYAALVLQPFVREQCIWTVQVHAEFQRYYYAHFSGKDRNARERHKDVSYYQDCVDFCERWDQASFDPDYDDLPLEFFHPMVMEVFDREPYDPEFIRAGERVPLVDETVARQRAAGA